MIIDSETQVEFKRRWTELPLVYFPPQMSQTLGQVKLSVGYLSVPLDSNIGMIQILACSFYMVKSVSKMAYEYYVMQHNLFVESPCVICFFNKKKYR